MTSYNINRRDGELDDAYHVRLFDDMEIHGLNYRQIADILNKEFNKNYDESKWRKDYAQYTKWYNFIASKIKSNEEVDEILYKKLELQKERNKLSAEKNEINKWLRDMARTENIYDKMEEAIKNLKPLDVPTIKIKNENSNKTAVINIADAHYGREGIIYGLRNEVMAEYSVKIFEQRMWKLLEESISIIEKENIKHVTVLNLSDSVDGLLRFSQLQFLELGVVDQTIQFAQFMSVWLRELSEYVTIDYRSCMGNHTEVRPLGSSKGDFKHENVERLIVEFIKVYLKNNDRVKVYDAEGILYFDIFGYGILATHGQDERNLVNSIKDYSLMYEVPVHILYTGHLHHESTKTVGMVGKQNMQHIQVPSIAGIDEYSLLLKKTAQAGTLVTIFKENYGKYISYDILL